MINKIIITGATGLIGKSICKTLLQQGKEITIFTRNPDRANKEVAGATNYVKWDYNNPDEWKEYLNINDAVIHLAGANLGAKRWNESYKKLAYDSRIINTQNLVEAIEFVDEKPKAFICASAVGFYGNRGDNYLSEDEEPADNYLAKLCTDWEKEAEKVENFGVRRVSVRTGLVLSKDEGLLKQMVPAFKFLLGGYLGNGMQWFPWIHIDDIAEIYMHAIYNESAGGRLNGAVNAVSPGIIRMKEFAKTLGRVLHRPSFLPIPKFAVKLLKGELGDYAMDSQKVAVNKLLQSGYKFKFENIENALQNILE
ncbi:MAG: TIGR01777 family oxidoreductase [Ignavibacteria bacterium]|nr:TIGR01777 family oxidoreductase [Ignavibacteria bacterium]